MVPSKSFLKVFFTAALVGRAVGDIVVPGANDTDGMLNITTNTVIDLSQAVTAEWDSDNSANRGKGVYDASKWAVVFKYSSVSIRSNATVTFKNHGSRAPVVWLVSGDVTIEAASVLSLNGEPGNSELRLAEPGPGGFRGSGSPGEGVPGASYSPGFGPGGGAGGVGFAGYGGPSDLWIWDSSIAPYGYSGVYGNPSLLPLLGGSGGGSNRALKQGGGAGGGAILIAAQRTLNVSGVIQADGGIGGGGLGIFGDENRVSGAGSGGGVRLIADEVIGGGRVQVLGGSYRNNAGPGRIRLERVNTDGAMTFSPQTLSVVPLQAGATAQVWLPGTGPSVRIVSIGGVTAPADPRANFGGVGADVSLPQTDTVPVVLETTNVEDAASVRVRFSPRFNAQVVEREATLQQVVNASPRVIRWTVDLPTTGGYAAIQARVIRP
jgi:hypothetical protein